MQVGVIGVNYKTADLSLREKVFYQIRALDTHLSLVILSTCNRIEIYFTGEDLAEIQSQLLMQLCAGIQDLLQHRIYSYFGFDCFLHLAKVTAGIDSALLFETEIQGQVKRAYLQAMEKKKLPKPLHFLFQKSLGIGKKIRREFSFAYQVNTLQEVTASLMESYFVGKPAKLLFVGFSEMNRKIANYLRNKKNYSVTYCNRSCKKEILQQGEFLPFEQLHEWPLFDVIITATKCPDFLITQAPVQQKRRLILDLSVPRNVKPSLGRCAEITLLHLDQIQNLMSRKKKWQARMLAELEGQEITKVVREHWISYHREKCRKISLVG